MTYEDVVKKAKQAAKKVEADRVGGHVAIQFDIEGEGEGAFYVEVSEGNVTVEPYEYFDHDCKVRAGADAVLAFLSGKLNGEEALAGGQLRLEGDGRKFAAFASAIKAAPKRKPAAAKAESAEKTPAKKADAEKTSAKKTTAKKTTK